MSNTIICICELGKVISCLALKFNSSNPKMRILHANNRFKAVRRYDKYSYFL